MDNLYLYQLPLPTARTGPYYFPSTRVDSNPVRGLAASTAALLAGGLPFPAAGPGAAPITGTTASRGSRKQSDTLGSAPVVGGPTATAPAPLRTLPINAMTSAGLAAVDANATMGVAGGDWCSHNPDYNHHHHRNGAGHHQRVALPSAVDAAGAVAAVRGKHYRKSRRSLMENRDAAGGGGGSRTASGGSMGAAAERENHHRHHRQQQGEFLLDRAAGKSGHGGVVAGVQLHQGAYLPVHSGTAVTRSRRTGEIRDAPSRHHQAYLAQRMAPPNAPRTHSHDPKVNTGPLARDRDVDHHRHAHHGHHQDGADVDSSHNALAATALSHTMPGPLGHDESADAVPGDDAAPDKDKASSRPLLEDTAVQTFILELERRYTEAEGAQVQAVAAHAAAEARVAQLLLALEQSERRAALAEAEVEQRDSLTRVADATALTLRWRRELSVRLDAIQSSLVSEVDRASYAAGTRAAAVIGGAATREWEEQRTAVTAAIAELRQRVDGATRQQAVAAAEAANDAVRAAADHMRAQVELRLSSLPASVAAATGEALGDSIVKRVIEAQENAAARLAAAAAAAETAGTRPAPTAPVTVTDVEGLMERLGQLVQAESKKTRDEVIALRVANAADSTKKNVKGTSGARDAACQTDIIGPCVSSAVVDRFLAAVGHRFQQALANAVTAHETAQWKWDWLAALLPRRRGGGADAPPASFPTAASTAALPLQQQLPQHAAQQHNAATVQGASTSSVTSPIPAAAVPHVAMMPTGATPSSAPADVPTAGSTRSGGGVAITKTATGAIDVAASLRALVSATTSISPAPTSATGAAPATGIPPPPLAGLAPSLVAPAIGAVSLSAPTARAQNPALAPAAAPSVPTTVKTVPPPPTGSSNLARDTPSPQRTPRAAASVGVNQPNPNVSVTTLNATTATVSSVSATAPTGAVYRMMTAAVSADTSAVTNLAAPLGRGFGAGAAALGGVNRSATVESDSSSLSLSSTVLSAMSPSASRARDRSGAALGAAGGAFSPSSAAGAGAATATALKVNSIKRTPSSLDVGGVSRPLALGAMTPAPARPADGAGGAPSSSSLSLSTSSPRPTSAAPVTTTPQSSKTTVGTPSAVASKGATASAVVADPKMTKPPLMSAGAGVTPASRSATVTVASTARKPSRFDEDDDDDESDTASESFKLAPASFAAGAAVAGNQRSQSSAAAGSSAMGAAVIGTTTTGKAATVAGVSNRPPHSLAEATLSMDSAGVVASGKSASRGASMETATPHLDSTMAAGATPVGGGSAWSSRRPKKLPDF